MPADDVVLRMRNAALDAAVVERVVGALAARIDLPVDRLEDARLLAATVLELARRHAANGRLETALAAEDGRIEMRVGPLVEGGAQAVVAGAEVPSVGNLVSLLGGGWEALDGDGSEALRVTVATVSPGGVPA